MTALLFLLLLFGFAIMLGAPLSRGWSWVLIVVLFALVGLLIVELT